MAGRPKKQTTESKTKKEKKVAEKEILAPATTYIGELPNSDNEKDSIDNLTLATKDLREQKSPVFDIKKQFDGDHIFAKYQEKCLEKSDINELLPKIYEIALQCETCVEFGVRRPTSTWAFLAAKPKMLTSYDIGRYDEEVSEVEQLCKEAGQGFEFILGSSAHVTIEETDCILIDTLHTKKMLETELALHADKVKKFILLHDTFGPYWETGEAPYNDETSPYGGGLGLKYAIEPFLESHPEWTIFARHDFNNGLMILKRN